MTQPDFTSPIAGRIEVRDPCPWCDGRPMVPRSLMAVHVAQMHPEVQTTASPALAEGGALPPAGRTALRDRIADAIRAAACPGNCGKTEEECARERIQPFAWHHGRLAVVEGTPEQFADAVLAVLPPPADRAAILREAEAKAREVVARLWDGGATQTALDRAAGARAVEFEIGELAAQSELRRMADETQPAPHRPSVSRWRVETLDNLADEWAPGTTWPLRELAAERYDLLNAQAPKWKDGTQVRRRLVRETTTYTIEAEVTPAAERQDGAQP